MAGLAGKCCSFLLLPHKDWELRSSGITIPQAMQTTQSLALVLGIPIHEKETGAEMRPVIVSGGITGDVLVSY